MVMLLNTLAHNVLAWAKGWLAESAPKLKHYGVLRLVRDVFAVTGRVEMNAQGQITSMVLNRGSTLAHRFLKAFRAVLSPLAISIELG